MSSIHPSKVLNINVGVLGHVDSGKTTLVRALSQYLSTAALDKSPESKQRGITLDLGFSAFMTDVPDRLKGSGFEKLQFTLVDCPGHASLIKTIIGGAQIIDMMLLVVDIQKGIQAQTAECLVIGEMMTRDMVLVLNKVDLLPEDVREAKVAKAVKKLRSALKATKFAKAPMIPVSALASTPVKTDATSASAPLSTSVAGLVDHILSRVQLPERSSSGPFYFAIDHCFPIRGKGTVMTGTVLAGSLAVNDMIALPALGLERKVKSMQMFHRPVQNVRQGDRVGICVASVDAKQIERGIAATPGSVPVIRSAIALVRKIRWFRGRCMSKSKFHVTVGHTTVMAVATFFGAKELLGRFGSTNETTTGEASDCPVVAEGTDSGVVAGAAAGAAAGAGAGAGAGAAGDASIEMAAPDGYSRTSLGGMAKENIPVAEYDWDASFEWQDELLLPVKAKKRSKKKKHKKEKHRVKSSADTHKARGHDDAVSEWQWAALQFDTPVLAPLQSLVIGSRLDSEEFAADCRVAFYGRLVSKLVAPEPISGEPAPSILRPLQLYRKKERRGVVDRIFDGEPGSSSPLTVIGKSLFEKGTDMSMFIGMELKLPDGTVGVLDSSFGKSGKFKVRFSAGARAVAPGDVLTMPYRRFIHDSSRRMEQSGTASRTARGKKAKK